MGRKILECRLRIQIEVVVLRSALVVLMMMLRLIVMEAKVKEVDERLDVVLCAGLHMCIWNPRSFPWNVLSCAVEMQFQK